MPKPPTIGLVVKRSLLPLLLLSLVAVADVAAQSDTTLPAEAPTLTKDPTTAVLLSLPLPGLGQLYNEQYWKIPVFTGTCAVSAFLFFKNNADFNATADLYDQAVANDADALVLDRLRTQREAYRDNRDLAGFVFLTAYVLAAVDAYVGAHLYDFDVSDDLSLGVGPSPSHLMALNLHLRW